MSKQHRCTTLFIVSMLIMFTTVSFAEQPIVIQMYAGWGEDRVLDTYFRLYEQLNPHIKIENLGSQLDFTKIVNLFAAGVAPDIIKLGTQSITSLYRLGFLATAPCDIRDSLVGGLIPISIQSVKNEDGELMGVPVESMCTGLWFNKRTLETGGIGYVPQDLDEIERIGKRLSEVDIDGNLLRSGLAHTGDALWALNQTALAFLFAEGWEITGSDGNFILETPSVYWVAERLAKWIGEKDFFGYGWNHMGDFEKGNVPLGYGYPWWLGGIKNNYSGDYNEDFELL